MMAATTFRFWVLLGVIVLKANLGDTLRAVPGVRVSDSAREADPTKHRSWKLLEHGRCGISAADRIIGGKNAVLGAYPWIVRIGYTHQDNLGMRSGQRRKAVFRCGGALISHYYVVTAAHCVTSLNGLEVSLLRLGEHNIRTNPDCEAGVCADPVQDFRPAQVLVHADYGKPAFRNDVALIRLERPAKFTDFVMPICMMKGKLLTKDYVGEPTDVAGWGIYDLEDQRASTVLQSITLRVVSTEDCAPRFSMYAEIGDTQMCVGGVVGQDSCGGDSGGPLMKVEALDGPPRYYLIGVVSFGSKRCGATTLPGIYTRMADFQAWVLENMRD